MLALILWGDNWSYGMSLSILATHVWSTVDTRSAWHRRMRMNQEDIWLHHKLGSKISPWTLGYRLLCLLIDSSERYRQGKASQTMFCWSLNCFLSATWLMVPTCRRLFFFWKCRQYEIFGSRTEGQKGHEKWGQSATTRKFDFQGEGTFHQGNEKPRNKKKQNPKQQTYP